MDSQVANGSRATLVGQLGLLMWGVSAVLVVSLHRIPTFEILSVVFLVSSIFSVVYISIQKRWSEVFSHPLRLWLIGILGICGNELLYVLSFKNAPPAHADLINYLWPLMVILGSSLLPSEKISPKHIIACAIAFSGAYILLTHGQGLAGFESQYIGGYLYALFAAIFWTVYTLVSRAHKKSMPEIVGMYCSVGFVVATMMHLHYETTIIPHASDIFALVFMGMTTHNLAYFCWNYGIKKGNFKLLSVLSYTAPLISISLLTLLGYTKPSAALFTATLLVFIGGLIGGVNWKEHFNFSAKTS